MGDWITWIIKKDIIPRTTHWLGLPPALTGGPDTRTALPKAAVLVIHMKGKTKGTRIFLHR